MLARHTNTTSFTLAPDDPAYPPLLGRASGAPPLLYCQGDGALLLSPSVAVVGTRRPTTAGRRRAGELAAAFVRRGLTVMSGLALGVDGEAHGAAMAAGGRTVAVLATPLERCAPPSHADLQRRLATEHLVVTRCAPGTPVGRRNFPIRDGLLAGLTAAVVVVEADDGSGTLHTVRRALALRRPVFVAPNACLGTWLDDALRRGACRLATDDEALDSAAARTRAVHAGATTGGQGRLPFLYHENHA